MIKLYAKRIKSTTEKNSKGTDFKVITTWHTDFDTVTKTVRGIEKESKVGKGAAYTPKGTVAAIDKGIYADTGTMTKDELNTLKTETNVKRMVNPRYINTIKAVRHLTAALKNNLVELPPHLKTALLSGLGTELAEMERVLNNEKKAKAAIIGLV